MVWHRRGTGPGSRTRAHSNVGAMAPLGRRAVPRPKFLSRKFPCPSGMPCGSAGKQQRCRVSGVGCRDQGLGSAGKQQARASPVCAVVACFVFAREYRLRPVSFGVSRVGSEGALTGLATRSSSHPAGFRRCSQCKLLTRTTVEPHESPVATWNMVNIYRGGVGSGEGGEVRAVRCRSVSLARFRASGFGFRVVRCRNVSLAMADSSIMLCVSGRSSSVLMNPNDPPQPLPLLNLDPWILSLPCRARTEVPKSRKNSGLSSRKRAERTVKARIGQRQRVSRTASAR